MTWIAKSLHKTYVVKYCNIMLQIKAIDRRDQWKNPLNVTILKIHCIIYTEMATTSQSMDIVQPKEDFTFS